MTDYRKELLPVKNNISTFISENRVLVGIIAAAAAGVAIASLLRTTKGQQLLNNITDTATDFASQLAERGKEFANNAQDFYNENKETVLNATKKSVDKVEHQVEHKVEA